MVPSTGLPGGHILLPAHLLPPIPLAPRLLEAAKVVLPPRPSTRQAVAAAGLPPVAPLAGLTFRLRENLHERHLFADKYSKLGSHK